jgi:SAM-dependent methyltransferase
MSLYSRANKLIRNPELLKFFFLLRMAKVFSRINQRSYNLTTRWMQANGIDRHVRNGKVYFSYKGHSYSEALANGCAMSNIKDIALKYCQGEGLDIGCNKWPLSGAYPIDNAPGENAYQLDHWPNTSLDFIFSSHCLEHLSEWQEALSLWISKIKGNGILFLYLPHSSMTLWQPGSPWVGNDHVWSPSAEILVPFLEARDMRIIAADPKPDNYHSFHVIAQKVIIPVQ